MNMALSDNSLQILMYTMNNVGIVGSHSINSTRKLMTYISGLSTQRNNLI
jgi:hypothetical protein